MQLEKAKFYSDNNNEKILRATMKSNVEKYLASDSIVILDSQNYIKGFRYELYCLARNAQSTLCVVWMDCPVEEARMRSEAAKPEQNLFPIELFEDYASRMEAPNAAKRWDQPLFQLRGSEPINDETLVGIQTALTSKAAKPKDPVSTKAEALFDENFLTELDKSC